MDLTPETSFFEAVYAGAGRDDASIPWQAAVSRPLVAEWLDSLGEPRRRVLVVAAGLGDDAAALAERGHEVTAFDASPSAVAWARERHPDAPVAWHVADLFELPEHWHRHFDVVLEVFTVQSIPPEQQDRAVDAVADLVGRGGELVVVALERSRDVDPVGPPWPLDPTTLRRPEAAGFTVVSERREPLAAHRWVVRRSLRRHA